jgi:hypothetical protein
MLLLELAALARRQGVPDDGHRHQAHEILDAMGVVRAD